MSEDLTGGGPIPLPVTGGKPRAAREDAAAGTVRSGGPLPGTAGPL
ncbi:hypothetical protein [Actinopolyspora erythraea]|nr:hypothetical protein [Actinopolyspora erythraea]